MTLSKRMLKFRVRNNLTQKQLAEMCGVNRCYLSEIENGAEPGKVVREKIELVVGGEDNDTIHCDKNQDKNKVR